MDERLKTFLAAGSSFAVYVYQYPALTERVLMNAIVLQHTVDAATLSELTAGRDAANSLHMIALEGDFSDLAALFYQCYELFCQKLLFFL